MKHKLASVLLGLAILAGAVIGVQAMTEEPADAAWASWGEGYVTGSSYGLRNVKIRDGAADGHTIRIRYKYAGDGYWRDAGVSYGGSEWGHFTIGCGCKQIVGVRMHRGYSGWLRTLEW